MIVQNKWIGAYYYQGQIDDATQKENGIGRRCWLNGGIEEGQFENGQPHGYCREIMADGSYFEGLWENGWRHGTGKELRQDSRKI